MDHLSHFFLLSDAYDDCTFLVQAVPSEPERLFEFEETAKAAIEFERAVRTEGFISVSETSEGQVVDDKLSAYCADVEVHLAAKKRLNVAEIARKLLVEMNFDSVEVRNFPSFYISL